MGKPTQRGRRKSTPGDAHPLDHILQEYPTVGRGKRRNRRLTPAELGIDLEEDAEKGSPGERALAFQMRNRPEFPHFEREFYFHPNRRFRSDFAFPAHKLLIEVQGGGKIWNEKTGGFVSGAHHSKDGYAGDCERMAEGMMLGYRFLYVTPEQCKSGKAADWILAILTQIDEG